MRELYTNPYLKKLIRDEFTNPDNSAYNKVLAKMRRENPIMFRKYLNSNLDKLAAILGEKLLLQQDNKGKYEIKPEYKNNNIEKTTEKVINNEPSAMKKMKDVASSVLKTMIGMKSGADKETEAMANDLIRKVESSGKFKEVIEKISKQSIASVFEEFTKTGQGRALFEQKVNKVIKDSKVLDRVYDSHNSGKQAQINRIQAQIGELQRKLNSTKK